MVDPYDGQIWSIVERSRRAGPTDLSVRLDVKNGRLRRLQIINNFVDYKGRQRQLHEKYNWSDWISSSWSIKRPSTFNFILFLVDFKKWSSWVDLFLAIGDLGDRL